MYLISSAITALIWPILSFWLPIYGLVVMLLGASFNQSISLTEENKTLEHYLFEFTMALTVTASPLVTGYKNDGTYPIIEYDYGDKAALLMWFYWIKIPLILPGGLVVLSFITTVLLFLGPPFLLLVFVGTLLGVE